MSPRRKFPWRQVVLLILSAGLYFYNQSRPKNQPTQRQPGGSSPSAQHQGSGEKTGNYEVYRSCTLAEAKNNDGDSFMLNLPGGKRNEFRLYFVDTPESAFKSYPGGDTNHQRIHEQATELGGITDQQAVDIGQQAKHFTLDLLAKQPFTIYTRWDSPFNDNRFHAFIQVQQNGQACWLHELLVEKGYVRIHTKGAELPDGTAEQAHKQHLKDLERSAKRARVGAWAY
jgi:endonuclease YncB( thermonuclease family)